MSFDCGAASARLSTARTPSAAAPVPERPRLSAGCGFPGRVLTWSMRTVGWQPPNEGPTTLAAPLGDFRMLQQFRKSWTFLSRGAIAALLALAFGVPDAIAQQVDFRTLAGQSPAGF